VVIDSNDESSSEIFDTTSFHTISVSSTAPHQFEWSISNTAGTQLAAGSFTDTSYASGHAGVVKNAGDGNVDIARFDNFYVREITVPPITQPHPRLLVTAADISEIQADIAARVEPRYSTWLQLRNRANAWSVDPPSVTAPYTGEDATQFFLAARGAGHRSSKMALAYLLDGNSTHAAKAKEILLEWARATPRPGTSFPPVNSTNYVGAGMNVARGIMGLVFTYDYLYNELSPTERADVESWFRDMLPVVRTAIETWDTPHQLSPTDPRGYVESSNLDNIYFYGQLYQNHSVSHTMAHLLIGYALGDRELVQFALDSKENPRSYLNLFEGSILMAGESTPDVYTVDSMNPPAQDGEIYDRYRQVQGTGLAYAALSLHQMMAMSEVLYLNGIDVYSRTGAHGETLRKPFEFYADFYRLGDSSIKGGFYTGEPVTAGSYPAAVFEVANKRYPGTPEITLLLNSIDRVAADAGGFPETYFCYPTLTHGVALPSWTGALGSDFEAAGNWNTAIPVDDAVSQVAFFDGTPPNMPQLTRHRSLAGMHLRGGNTTLSASAGQVLTLGALGIGNGAAGTAAHTISAALHLAAPQSWNVPSGKTLTVSGNITGTTGLTKSGVGSLTLSGANTYTGETNIREGLVTISKRQCPRCGRFRKPHHRSSRRKSRFHVRRQRHGGGVHHTQHQRLGRIALQQLQHSPERQHHTCGSLPGHRPFQPDDRCHRPRRLHPHCRKKCR
jgi:autotransporter-associated beta strand protein